MIYIKDHKQADLFGLWSFRSPKRRQLLAQSWVVLLIKQILCELRFLRTVLADRRKNHTLS